MKYLVILTVQISLPDGGGAEFATEARIATPGPGTTRSELYKCALEQLPERFRDSNTLFFSAEPDALTGGQVPAPAAGKGVLA